MTAPRIAAESVRLHENNTPKDERFYSAVQRSLGVYKHRRKIRTGDDVRVALQSTKLSLKSSRVEERFA